MMNKYKTPRRRSRWWTRERIIIGMKRFYDDFGFCAISSEKWAEYAQFSATGQSGAVSNLGWENRYPSFSTILANFPTLRHAWRAAGFEVDSGHLEWSPIEDWFIIESVGILSREEISRTIGRTDAAIKRRLYDLGRITAHTRWGFTITGAAHAVGIAEHILRRYLDHGAIPYFRGHYLIYINPADLTRIPEIDWDKVPPEVQSHVRRCLVQRAIKILKYGSEWRQYEIYKFLRKEGIFTRRIRNRTPVSIDAEVPPPPNDLAVGDWIRTTSTNALDIAGRVGVVRAVHYSPIVCARRDGSYRSCWVARIDFPRLRHSAVSNDTRIRYTLPLDVLERTEVPVIERPLSQHPEAVRGRKRKARGEYRTTARINMEELRSGGDIHF